MVSVAKEQDKKNEAVASRLAGRVRTLEDETASERASLRDLTGRVPPALAGRLNGWDRRTMATLPCLDEKSSRIRTREPCQESLTDQIVGVHSLRGSFRALAGCRLGAAGGGDRGAAARGTGHARGAHIVPVECEIFRLFGWKTFFLVVVLRML